MTLDTPKPLLEVNGRSIIERSISNLRRNGIDEIGVVVGYLRERFLEALKDGVTFIDNPRYATTNNMASLWYARDFVGGDEFVYLHGDVVYHPDILEDCLRCDGDITLMVDKKKCDEEDMKVRVAGDRFLGSSKDIPVNESYGEWIGIAKFSAKGGSLVFSEIDKVLDDGKNNAYDTYAFTGLAMRDHPIDICHTRGLSWVEIDFPEELERAKKICLAMEKEGE